MWGRPQPWPGSAGCPIPPLLSLHLPLWFPPGVDVSPPGQESCAPLHLALPELSPWLCPCCLHFWSSPGPCWLQTLRESNTGVTSGRTHHLLLLSLVPPLLGHWDPFRCILARPSLLLPGEAGYRGAQGAHRALLPSHGPTMPKAGPHQEGRRLCRQQKARQLWEKRGDRAGHRDTRGQQEPTPCFGGRSTQRGRLLPRSSSRSG